MSGFRLPAPGARGDYRGSCAVCLQGTDTGLAFVGEAEWGAAGLQVLGIPSDQAAGMVSQATGSQPGMVPEGEVTIAVTVCSGCAGKAGLPVGLIATGVPAVRPRT